MTASTKTQTFSNFCPHGECDACTYDAIGVCALWEKWVEANPGSERYELWEVEGQHQTLALWAIEDEPHLELVVTGDYTQTWEVSATQGGVCAVTLTFRDGSPPRRFVAMVG